jgi:hypothetical protein
MRDCGSPCLKSRRRHTHFYNGALFAKIDHPMQWFGVREATLGH